MTESSTSRDARESACHGRESTADTGRLRLRFDLNSATPGATDLVADSSAAIGGQGFVALSGRPHWQSRELAELARREGDAAALAAAYIEDPEHFTRMVSGAVAFALYDADRSVLLAGIDRIGQCTLYHALNDGQLLLADDAGSLLRFMPEPAQLSAQGIYDYVYFHMVPSPVSVYAGVSKLPAAHLLEYSAGQLRQRRYWQPHFQRKPAQSFDAAASELRRVLRDAVQRAAGTGVVGSFLSGGLDSSTVTGMLAELSDCKAPAYAIGFDEPGYDEMAYARTAARHFGVPLREYYVTPQDVMAELPTIAHSYDEPFGNSSALPAYFCARRAVEDGIDYLLAGDGGDELFAGNSRYAKQQVFELYGRIPNWARRGLVEPAVSVLPESLAPARKLRSYIAQALIPLPDRLESYNFLNRIAPVDMFSDRFLQLVDTGEPISLQRATYASLDRASELSRMLYLDWQYTLADNDLRKVNRMCAVAGIGVRYPMLDEELVAFSCEIPDKWKLRRGDLRHFYKQALSGWLPEETIRKKKQGFGLPFGRWMQSYRPLSELAGDCIDRLKGRGYFRPEFLDRLLRLHREEHAAFYGELVWVLTVLDLWLENRDAPNL